MTIFNVLNCLLLATFLLNASYYIDPWINKDTQEIDEINNVANCGANVTTTTTNSSWSLKQHAPHVFLKSFAVKKSCKNLVIRSCRSNYLFLL